MGTQEVNQKGVPVQFVIIDTATTEIYTLSLHDALPICGAQQRFPVTNQSAIAAARSEDHVVRQRAFDTILTSYRSEEHTSELQSQSKLVCRLLLEKKTIITYHCSGNSRHSSMQITEPFD